MKYKVFHSLTVAALVSQAAAASPDFVDDVQPILERSCVRCHNDNKTKGGLQMDTYEALMEGGDTSDAVVPGDPQASELIIRLHLRPIDEGVMPQKGRALEPDEVATLEAWIKAGAEWPDGVVLEEIKPEPVARVSIPDRVPVSAADAANILDDIIARQNEGKEVITTEPVEDLVFLRRASIDIIGRIPTVKEIEEFESWGEDRREKLVAKLLSHPRYAERWTVFMADMLRIRSSAQGGNQLLAYVNKSLAEEKRYDDIVRELLSASGTANANPAVGYILADDADPMELAAATAQTFMGVRLGCAMCHDHPFDDWEQKDLYELAAYFGKTRMVSNRTRGMVYATEGEEMTIKWPPEDKADPERRSPVRPKFPISLSEPTLPPSHIARFEETLRKIEELDAKGNEAESLDALLDAAGTIGAHSDNSVLAEARKESRQLNVHGDIYRSSELRSELADLITNPNNEFFAKAFVNRIWAELLGHGFVEPLDNFSPYVDMNHASALDFLSQEFVASGFDIKHLISIITLSDTYRRASLGADVALTIRETSEENFTAAPTRRMIGEVLYDSIVAAGHLKNYKWPAGANKKEIKRQVRVPTGEYVMVESDDPPADETMMAMPQKRGDGYDL